MNGKNNNGSETDFSQVRKDHLKKVLNAIWFKAQDCSPTTLKIGYTTESNHVQHDAIVILNCAPAIVNAIRDCIDSEKLCLRISAGNGGVVVS